MQTFRKLTYLLQIEAYKIVGIVPVVVMSSACSTVYFKLLFALFRKDASIVLALTFDLRQQLWYFIVCTGNVSCIFG